MELHAARGAPYLIAAVTGRALAMSARRGGHPVVVLDCFADRDCAAEALAAEPVAAPSTFHFDRRALLDAAARLAPSGRCAGLVIGSGFEARPGLLRALAAGRRLLGNAPPVSRLVKDPGRFVPLLDHLGIPHPETRLTPPVDPGGWLVKRIGGAGGTHVRPASPSPPPARSYYQKVTPGWSGSVLFLADGRRAVMLGWNRQLTVARSGAPYLFGGAVGGVSLPAPLARDITTAVQRLVEATGLVGLNGADFLVQDNRWSLLEVNPRPTATMELYDPDWPHGLFGWHLAACEGRLPGRVPAPRAARALAVLHSPSEWVARDGALPGWCRDLPTEGTRFAPGDPVCTVHAAGSSPDEAYRLLEHRCARLERTILRGRYAAAV